MNASPPDIPRWRRAAYWGLLLTPVIYLLLATSLFSWLIFDMVTLELSWIEPPPGQVVPQSKDQTRYAPGRYGPDRPFFSVMFGDHTPRTTINKQGLRAPMDLGPELKDCVVLLGDSFTFGFGLDDDQTLAAHLSQLDPESTYLNAGQPLFDLHDSASRLEEIMPLLPRPRAVVLQVLFANDLTSEKYTEQRMFQLLEEARRLRWPPFHLRRLDPLFGDIIRDRFWGKISKDLTRERFDLYFKQAIARVAQTLPDGTPLALLVFQGTPAGGMANFHLWLRAYAKEKALPYFDAKELLSPRVFSDARLSDWHPSGEMNKALARALLPRLKAMVEGAASQ